MNLNLFVEAATNTGLALESAVRAPEKTIGQWLEINQSASQLIMLLGQVERSEWVSAPVRHRAILAAAQLRGIQQESNTAYETLRAQEVDHAG